MPRSEDHFVPDPRVEATLAVIAATLAGEAVQPEQAEMAELSLILAEQRPAPRPQFTAGLDARVQRRFAVTAPEPGSRRRHRRRWLYAPGAVVGAAAATAVVIALAGGGLGAGSRPPLPEGTAVPSMAAGKSAPAATGPRSGFAAAPSHESLQGH